MHRQLKQCLAAAAAALFAASAAFAQQSVKTTFEDPQGKQIGTATPRQPPAGVSIQIDAEGLPPGGACFPHS